MIKIQTVKVHQVTEEGTLSFVIPKEIREKLKIKAGDKLLVGYENNKVVAEKL